MRTQRIYGGCFDHLWVLYSRAKEMLDSKQASDVLFSINGVEVRVTPYDTPLTVEQQYKRKLNGGIHDNY